MSRILRIGILPIAALAMCSVAALAALLADDESWPREARRCVPADAPSGSGVDRLDPCSLDCAVQDIAALPTPKGRLIVTRSAIVQRPDLSRSVTEFSSLFHEEAGSVRFLARTTIRNPEAFEPREFAARVVQLGHDQIVQLAPAARDGFLLHRDRVQPIDLLGWVEIANAQIPAKFVGGRASIDLQSMTGRIPLFPVGADTPTSSGSAFAPISELAVPLSLEQGRLVGTDGALRQHPPADIDTAQFPDATMACDLRAWNGDSDPAGLNVRAAPSRSAPVVGRLQGPVRFRPEMEVSSYDDVWRVPFRIIGYRDGWFLIDGASPHDPSQHVIPARATRTFTGRGWVAAGMVGSALTSGGTRLGGLFQAPHVEAKWTPARDAQGKPLDAESMPKRILACSGIWALIESHDGVIGWWPRLCNAQVTNCS